MQDVEDIPPGTYVEVEPDDGKITEALQKLEAKIFKQQMDKQQNLTSLMSQQQQNQLLKSITIPQTWTSTGLTWTGVSTFSSSMVKQQKISTKLRKHSDGYYSDVAVLLNDTVCWKVFKTHALGALLYKMGFKTKDALGEWQSCEKYDKLEATIGGAYIQIEKAIDDDLKKTNHKKFVKDILKTDPDNLKMISELKKLDGGSLEENPGTVSNITSFPRLSQTVKVAGSGAYYNNKQ